MRLAAAIIVTLLLAPTAVLSAAGVLMIPFLFDAPGTEDQVAMWCLAGAVLSLPPALLAALVAVWIAVPAERSLWWYAALTLPALSGLAFIVAGRSVPGFF